MKAEWTDWHEKHESKIELIAGVDCWIWIAGTGSAGYGRVKYAGQPTNAHRAAFLEFGGTFANGRLVRHLCGNRLCVRPGHLKAGSHADNAKDTSLMFCSKSKLSGSDVVAIRSMYDRGDTLKDIADKFGIAYGSVFPIVSGKSFRYHAPETVTIKGTRRPRRLDRELAQEIRVLLAQGHLSQAKIAVMFGVSQPHINAIATGRRWADKNYLAVVADALAGELS